MRGVGLGDRFLGHAERCASILHLIDGTGDAVAKTYKIIRAELEAYGRGLEDKPEIVALNKVDAIPQHELEKKRAALEKACGHKVHVISGVTGAGSSPLCCAPWCGRSAPAAPNAPRLPAAIVRWPCPPVAPNARRGISRAPVVPPSPKTEDAVVKSAKIPRVSAVRAPKKKEGRKGRNAQAQAQTEGQAQIHRRPRLSQAEAGQACQTRPGRRRRLFADERAFGGAPLADCFESGFGVAGRSGKRRNPLRLAGIALRRCRHPEERWRPGDPNSLPAPLRWAAGC